MRRYFARNTIMVERFSPTDKINRALADHMANMDACIGMFCHSDLTKYGNVLDHGRARKHQRTHIGLHCRLGLLFEILN